LLAARVAMTPPIMGTDVRLAMAKGVTLAAPATAMITPATGEKLLNNPPAN